MFGKLLISLRSPALVAGFVCVGLLWLAGCASTPPVNEGPLYDPNKPQVFLPNADVVQAKGVAMGSAVGKGWTLVQAETDFLVLQRELDAAARQALSLDQGAAPLPPLVEVQTQFFPRPGGVVVVLEAQLITQRGTQQEQRLEFTEPFRPDLTRSLRALSLAWQESGWRLASPVPLASPEERAPSQELAPPPAPASEATGSMASQPPPASPMAPAGPAPVTVPEPTPEPPPPSLAERPPVTAPGTAYSAWGGSSTPVAGAIPPVEERLAEPAPPIHAQSGWQVAPPITPPAGPGAEPAPRPVKAVGIWAYYAEHHARIRGCQITATGAQLLERRQLAEIHRVDCQDGRHFLVQCHAGDCHDLR